VWVVQFKPSCAVAVDLGDVREADAEIGEERGLGQRLGEGRRQVREALTLVMVPGGL
jgi:hypothetical protein